MTILGATMTLSRGFVARYIGKQLRQTGYLQEWYPCFHCSYKFSFSCASVLPLLFAIFFFLSEVSEKVGLFPPFSPLSCYGSIR